MKSVLVFVVFKKIHPKDSFKWTLMYTNSRKECEVQV